MNDLIEQLKSEPAPAWEVPVSILGAHPDFAEARQAAVTTRNTSPVSTLLASHDTTGSAYRKWTGSHWLVSILVDLGCHPGDRVLRPLMDETFDCGLDTGHDKHIRLIDGRVRLCASQDVNAI